MSVKVVSEYVGALTVKNTHGPSGAEFQTTAPVDNGGTGELFSPTDLVAASLGSCMLTIMGKVAERDDIAIKGASVVVEKEMTENPRRIKKLKADFNIPFSYTDREKRKLEAAAKTCPVKQSLHPDTELILNFTYLD